MPAQAFYDYTQYDYDKPLYTLEDIRQVNPQRFEMEQLTGIVWVDEVNHGMIGFKEVRQDDFWVPGHMPGFPLMPGVLMCEAAAQLAGFYARKYNVLEVPGHIGFGGMQNVRFRQPVYPGCRLILCARATRIKPRIRAEFEFQGFVGDKQVFNGDFIGVPLKHE